MLDVSASKTSNSISKKIIKLNSDRDGVIYTAFEWTKKNIEVLVGLFKLFLWLQVYLTRISSVETSFSSVFWLNVISVKENKIYFFYISYSK